MIVDNVLKLIGNTPMVRLRLEGNGWELHLKLEKCNPGQSIKDRASLGMVRDAEASGRLRVGGTIIESSSGNTAIGLAMIAAARGYRFVAVLDPFVPVEKVNIIRAYGAEIADFADFDGMDFATAHIHREKWARELNRRTPNSIYIDQDNNPANTATYPATLATELVADVPGFEILFGAIGTTGSICGTAKGLRAAGHACKVIAVEPKGSIFFSEEGGPYLQTGTGCPPGAPLPRILDRSVIDEGLQVTDSEAFSTCRVMARRFGILLGGSAGGVLFKAIEYARALPGAGKAVILAADGGERYLSTVYNDEWMRKHKLLNLDLEERIGGYLRRD